METLAEAQEEVTRQIARRLEAENEVNELEQKWRSEARENAQLKAQIVQLRAENAELDSRVARAEGELADLSSSLLEQANQQVTEANKRAAAAQMMLEEGQEVIASQAAQLQALKEMLESLEQQHARGGGAAPSSRNGFLNAGASTSQRKKAVKQMARNGRPSEDLVLDLDSYLSPFRPMLRTDMKDFQDFVAVFGCDLQSAPGRWKIETPAWRKPRFVQRLIVEDVEPTLRLDRTPHLSWLTCRAFLAGVLDQTITLEPVSPRELSWSLRPSQPCLLCGENRSDGVYARSYWARLSPDAEPIVLDLTCVTKARLVCELVAFVKSVAKRKPADHAAHVRAWLQCNAMREQLFWVRTGGFFSESEEKMSQLLELIELDDTASAPGTPLPTDGPFPTTPFPPTPQPGAERRLSPHAPGVSPLDPNLPPLASNRTVYADLQATESVELRKLDEEEREQEREQEREEAREEVHEEAREEARTDTPEEYSEAQEEVIASSAEP